MSMCAQRGVSHVPGRLGLREKPAVEAKAGGTGHTFDKKAWHRRKAAEARERQKQEKQIRRCYDVYTPPQERELERMMKNNRAVGL